MSVLRVFWQPAWPDAAETLAWALLDKQGVVQSRGQDAPGAWPAAGRLELILPAGHCLFLAARLPAGRQLQGEALGFVLEEQLGNDPAANLYQLAASLPDGRRQIAVVELASLRHAVARLQQLGREVSLITPQECLLPADGEALQLAETAAGWAWRAVDGECGFVARPLAATLLPRLLAGAAAVRMFGAWPPALAQPDNLQPLAAFDWQAGMVRDVPNFARGLLAPRSGKKGWLQTLGWTLLGLLLLQTLVLGGVSGWLAWQKQQLQQQIRAELRPWAAQAMPGNAVQPMRQALDGLKRARGQIADNDVLLMAAELAALPGASALRLESLDYADGVLRFQSAALNEVQLAQWRPLLASRQLKIVSGSNEQGGREWRLLRGN